MSRYGWAAAAALVMVVSACGQANGEAAPQGGGADPLEATFAAYESARAQLVDDQLSAALQSARQLSQHAERAAVKGGASAGALKTLARVATAMGKAPAGDAHKVRVAFGEVSRALVALIAADPALKKRFYLFECPMAEGYKKWVQRDKKLANPYMGQSMPHCGGPGQWG